MSKIGALFHNEIIKTRRRVSVLVITIIMIAAIVGISGLIKIEEVWLDSGYIYPAYDIYSSDLSSTNDYLNQLEPKIAEAKEKEDKEALLSLCKEKISNLTYRSVLELRIDYTRAGSLDFRDDLIETLSTYLERVNQYTVMEEAFPGTQNKAEYESAQQTVTALTEILKQQDYAGYVEYSKGLIRSMDDISQEEKELLLEKWDILLKLDPAGGIGDSREKSRTEYARNVANTVEGLAKTIIYERNFTDGYNDGSQAVTPKQLETYRDRLAAVRYCIDNDIEISNTDSGSASVAYSLVSSIANSLITLLLIILAGSTISNEISTGSIKSLIIAPVRRWKIFTAKLLALLSVAAALMLVKYVCLAGTQSLFWPDAIRPYVYASSGTAHSINYYLYQLAYCFAELMPIFMVAVFALMLSTTTRNTALSVGLSMGIYFGGSVAATILNAFSSEEWLKFIPFNNMDLADKLFPLSSLMSNAWTNVAYGQLSMQSGTSALFTLVYIIVLSLCMLYIAFDSFTRRDI